MTTDATKAPFNKDLKTILYVIRDNGGCGYYRCLQPAMYLRQFQLMNSITDLKETTPEHIDQADIVVFQEIGSNMNTKAFQYAQQLGKAVVVESDDFLHSVSPNNPGYAAWNPGTLFLSRAVEKMKKANAMTVSTPQMAREYSLFNKNVYVLPNFLNKNIWDAPVIKKNDGIIRIGWAGGNSHFDDLRMIVPVIKKIVKEYEGKVRFELMGMIKKELHGIFDELEDYVGICPKCDYQGELLSLPGQPLQDYPAILASHGWDIGLAPVVNTAFNNAKSDLKLKEYSAVGYAPIASNVTPYREAKQLGCDVLLAETFDEWYNSIKLLIENKDKRDEIVSNNKEWAEKNWMEVNIKKYSDVYHQIISNSLSK